MNRNQTYCKMILAIAFILFAVVISFVHYFDIKNLKFGIPLGKTPMEVLRFDHLPTDTVRKSVRRYRMMLRDKIPLTKKDKRYYRALIEEYKNRRV